MAHISKSFIFSVLQLQLQQIIFPNFVGEISVPRPAHITQFLNKEESTESRAFVIIDALTSSVL